MTSPGARTAGGRCGCRCSRCGRAPSRRRGARRRRAPWSRGRPARGPAGPTATTAPARCRCRSGARELDGDAAADLVGVGVAHPADRVAGRQFVVAVHAVAAAAAGRVRRRVVRRAPVPCSACRTPPPARTDARPAGRTARRSTPPRSGRAAARGRSGSRGRSAGRSRRASRRRSRRRHPPSAVAVSGRTSRSCGPGRVVGEQVPHEVRHRAARRRGRRWPRATSGSRRAASARRSSSSRTRVVGTGHQRVQRGGEVGQVAAGGRRRRWTPATASPPRAGPSRRGPGPPPARRQAPGPGRS